MLAGGGILRLHSTFRHDLKIKTSDEGRVMKTAASFAKGLLELDGDREFCVFYFRFLRVVQYVEMGCHPRTIM